MLEEIYLDHFTIRNQVAFLSLISCSILVPFDANRTSPFAVSRKMTPPDADDGIRAELLINRKSARHFRLTGYRSEHFSRISLRDWMDRLSRVFLDAVLSRGSKSVCISLWASQFCLCSSRSRRADCRRRHADEIWALTPWSAKYFSVVTLAKHLRKHGSPG